MKISTRQLFLSAAIACFFTLTLAALAQDNKQPDPAPPPAPAEKSPAVAAPAEATPAAGAEAPAESKPEAASPESPKLRRLDSDDTTDAPKSHKEIIHESIGRALDRVAARHAASVGRDIVNIFNDSNLSKGEKADSVVAVFGSATAEGEVTDSVVSVFGSSRASGSVSDAVVSVLGDNEVTGPVGDAAVSVLGNNSVNSHVHGDVVAVLGDIKLGPAAEVDGQVVCVGGTVTKDSQAILHHGIQNVGGSHSIHGLNGLKAWVRECLLYGRPLAFGPNLMWAWWIALGFLAFYVVLALLFGKGVNKCVETLEQRPGYSILAALLTVLLAPIAMILLAITGIGIAVIPFLAAGIFFATLFGKVVMLAWIGRRFSKLIGSDHPALAVLIGGVILLFLYTVPVLGFILFKLLGWVGIGVVVYTLVLGMKREKPAVPPVVPPAPTPPIAPLVTPGDPAAPSVPPASPLVAPALVAPVVMAPPILSAATLTRAGFWIRLMASLLDAMLVGIAVHLVPLGTHLSFALVYAVYCVIFWALKGTTIGGIVFGLKVVRLDDRPVDATTAIVRALGGFLSLLVCGFGFLWVVFDDQRQSWHDKIAGTTIVRVPKGVSLV